MLGNAAFMMILLLTMTVWRFVEIGKMLATAHHGCLGRVLLPASHSHLENHEGGMRQTISGIGTALGVFVECMRRYYEALERFSRCGADSAVLGATLE